MPLTSASPLEAPVDDRSTLRQSTLEHRMAALSLEWSRISWNVGRQLYEQLEAMQMASIMYHA